MGSNIITSNLPLIKSLVDLAIRETLTTEGYVDATALSIALASKLDKTFASSLITNISVALTNTDVNLELDSIAPANGQTATGFVNIPLASQTTPGIMPKEAYAQIYANTQSILALSQLSGHFVGSFPTKADLLNYELQPSDVRGSWATVQEDETNDNALARYFLEDDGNDGLAWVLDYLISYAPTPQATNESLGTVKGEDTEGKIFVEEDGTMSLVGFNSLGTDIANLSQSLSSISSSKENTILMPSTGPLGGLTPSQAFARLNNFLNGAYIAPATISANGFNAVTTYSVTVDGEFGTGSGSYVPGSLVSISPAEGPPGGSFLKWETNVSLTFTNGTTINDANATFIMPSQNVTLTSSWRMGG